MKRLWRVEVCGGYDKPCTSIGWYDARTFFGALVVGFFPTYRQLRSVTSRPLSSVQVTRETTS